MHLYDWVSRLEDDERLDGLGRLLDHAMPEVLRRHRVRELLSGTWLGHALHPLLTDFPLGCWTAATLLDLTLPRSGRRASTVLTGIGVLAALPTTASGVVEWQDTGQRERRVASLHGFINLTALAGYALSFAAKVRGAHRAGAAAAVAAGLTATFGGYLGGHLSFARGVGVDRAIHQRDRHGWIQLKLQWREEAVAAATADPGERFLVVGTAADQVAVPDRCTRCGGPLQLDGGAVLECVADGSRFDLEAAAVVRGPATTPLPTFEVRDNDGLSIRRR